MKEMKPGIHFIASSSLNFILLLFLPIRVLSSLSEIRIDHFIMSEKESYKSTSLVFI
ncbi:Uncharacterised protein [Chryseobacterium indologenes]|nr:Uncharacterised protein [Chryseobacterium indologenes]